MIPYLLAIAGGYLIGSSRKDEKFGNGGMLPDIELEKKVPEKLIYEEFEKLGYDAFDINYSHTKSEAEIVVSPRSYAYDGGFSKNFSQQMQQIRQKIGADDVHFTATFQVVFIFDLEKHPDLQFN